MGYARSGRGGGGVHLDPVTIALALGIVLLGLVMVTSASVSIASQATGEPFYYLGRQLLLTLIGLACAALLFSIPTPLLERASGPLLTVAVALLGLVLIPGLGHAVNGSRRWLRLACTSRATRCGARRSCASRSPGSPSPSCCSPA
jgi:cell division protein FtsW